MTLNDFRQIFISDGVNVTFLDFGTQITLINTRNIEICCLLNVDFVI